MRQIAENALKILGIIAIALGIFIIINTGGYLLVLGAMIIGSGIILFAINYVIDKTKQAKLLKTVVAASYLLVCCYCILKWQEHTTFIFSKTSKKTVAIIFGISGYPKLPPTHFWRKTVDLSNKEVIITSTKIEEMPVWQRYKYKNGETILGDNVKWQPNFNFPCIINNGVVKAWVFDLGQNSDSAIQKQIVGLVNKINLGVIQTIYKSSAIDIIKVNNATYINLQRSGLAYLPEAVSSLPINTIYLAENSFTTIPTQLYKISSLKTIILSVNPIKALPDNLWKLKNLKSLSIGKTEIRQINTDFSKSDSLDDIDISRNELSEFPEMIKTIPHLKTLSIDENELTNLSFIDKKLGGLESLQIQSNRISSISSNVKHLPKLKSLLIFDNKIDSIPAFISSLTNLEELEIWDNPIRYISPEIRKLKKLRELRLDDNFLSKKDQTLLKQWLPKCNIHFQTRTSL